MKRRRTELWVAAFLLIAAIVFCGRAVFTGRALMPFDLLLLWSPWEAHSQEYVTGAFTAQNQFLDPIQQYYPWRAFAVSSLKEGLLPLWNPYSYCGQPFLANLQSALFYPPNLIFLVMPLWAAFTWGVVLHLFIAGLFGYLLLRKWQLSPLAALLGAVAFMFNGFIVGWMEYPAVGLWVICWLPAMLFCYETALATRRWRWALICGVVIGLQFAGGHLQIAAFSMLAFVLFVAWKAVAAGPRQEATRKLAFAAVALALGLALAMVQLLPTLELASLSARAPKTFAQAREFAFPLSHLVLYLIPNFFGNPANNNYWGNLVGNPQVNFIETGCYVGVITLLLAWLGARLWRRPEVGFLLALTVISILMALGSPLYALFFYAVPGAKQLAGLGRFLSLAAFGLAGLGAFGLDRLLKREVSLKKWELPLFAAGALLLAAAAWGLYAPALLANPPLFENFVKHGLRFLAILATSLFLAWLLARGEQDPNKPSRKHKRPAARNLWPAAGLLALALLIVDLFSFGMTFNSATDPRLAFFDTEVTDYLQAQSGPYRMVSYRPAVIPQDSPQMAREWMLPNTPLAYGLRDTHGYDSLVPGRYTQLIGSTNWSDQGRWPAPESGLADLLAIRYALSVEALQAAGWTHELAAETHIYLNEEALPRAFLVPAARALPAEECLQTVRQADFDFRHEVLLCEGGGAGGTAALGPEETAGTARFVRDGINTVELEAASTQTAWLVLSDTAYPGWRAEIDGTPHAWQVGNWTFRALRVPPGSHHVKWSFEPASFKVGLFISLIALGVLAGCATLRLTTAADRKAE